MAFGVDMRVKNLFFDRPEVQRRVDQKNRRALSKAGAFVRRTARSLIGSPAKKAAPRAAGLPVRARSKNRTVSLRNILFAFDGKDSVVVGPVKLSQKSYLNGVLMSGTVPQLHEFGGTAGIREKLVGGEWRPYGRRRPRSGQPVRVRRAQYPARPYMRPALAKEAPKFPSLWSGQTSSEAA